MTLRKSILLFVGLGMIASLVACGGSSHKNTTVVNTTPAIAATSGGGQSVTVGTAFAPLVATVTLNGSPSSGASVTFAAPPSGASCTFANNTNTETDPTNASGVAMSSVCTANATAGSYNVTASTTGASAPASFSLKNTAVALLGDGTYVFSVAGQDVAGAYLYNVAGAFTVVGGVITGGEQDLVDYGNPATLNDAITSGTISGPDAAGNLTITLTTADAAIGVSGTETLSAVMATSGTAGFITEFDSSASGSGELRLQSLPSGGGKQGYAFFLNGGDGTVNAFASGFGGVVNVDGAGGTISGAGSVFDLDDGGTLTQGAPIDSGTVSAPDAFGRIQISLVLTTSGVGGIGLAGYIVDDKRIELVENSNDPNDIFFGVTGGTAYPQGASTGTFTAASIEGTSFVFGTNGQDATNYFQVAGVVTTNLDGTTVSGTLNFNDLSGAGTQAPVPFSGTYTVDVTGRVTLSNLASNDGTTFSGITLQLYLSGGGRVAANAMDSFDEWAGPAKVQSGGGTFTAGSLSGNYALVTTGFGLPANFTGPETDSVGFFTADGVSAFNPGAVDQNILTTGGVAGAQTPDVAFTGAYVADPSGIFTGTITGLDISTPANADAFSYYLIDSTSGVAIETDTNQLTLGFFSLE
jgi:hypothetical protein